MKMNLLARGGFSEIIRMEILLKRFLARESLTWGTFNLEGPPSLARMPKSEGT